MPKKIVSVAESGLYRVRAVTKDGLATQNVYSAIRYDKYEGIIQQLLADVAALKSGTPIPDPTTPIVGNSSINGSNDIPLSLTQVIFPLTAEHGVLSIANQSLITVTGGATKGISTIVSGQLIVPISGLAYSTTYTVTVMPGAISNSGVLNTEEVTTTLTTKEEEIQPTVPVVGSSSIDGSNDATLETNEVTFPINAEHGTLSVANQSLITVTGEITKGVATIVSGQLVVPISGLAYSTTYTVTVMAGAVSNSGVLNTQATTATFTTKVEELQPTVPFVGSSSIHEQVDVPITLEQIVLPITYENGTLSVANQDTIVASGGLTKGTAIIQDNNLVIPISNLQKGVSYSITVNPGTVENSGVPNDNIVVITWDTEQEQQVPDPIVPIVEVSVIHETQDVAVNTTEIIFPIKIEGDNIDLTKLVVANQDAITVSDGLIKGTAFISSNPENLIIPVSGMQHEQSYWLTVTSGAVSYDNTPNDNEITVTWDTEQQQQDPNPENPYEWEILFQLRNFDSSIFLDSLLASFNPEEAQFGVITNTPYENMIEYNPEIHQISYGDWYGFPADGSEHGDVNRPGEEVYVEVIYLGTNTQNQHGLVYEPHPHQSYDWEPNQAMAGKVELDFLGTRKRLIFSSGPGGVPSFKLVRYKQPVNRTTRPY